MWASCGQGLRNCLSDHSTSLHQHHAQVADAEVLHKSGYPLHGHLGEIWVGEPGLDGGDTTFQKFADTFDATADRASQAERTSTLVGKADLEFHFSRVGGEFDVGNHITESVAGPRVFFHHAFTDVGEHVEDSGADVLEPHADGFDIDTVTREGGKTFRHHLDVVDEARGPGAGTETLNEFDGVVAGGFTNAAHDGTERVARFRSGSSHASAGSLDVVDHVSDEGANFLANGNNGAVHGRLDGFSGDDGFIGQPAANKRISVSGDTVNFNNKKK